MIELLEQVVEELKKLPDADQDEAAEFLVNLMAKRHQPLEPDPNERATVEEGLAQADRGEFVSDQEMTEFVRRRGA